jgi:hypothetical protein
MTPVEVGLAVSALVSQDDSEVVVLGNSRDDFILCELGISFDGVMIYSNDKLVEHFMEHDGMDEDEAQEWIDFNIVRSSHVVVA